MIGFFQRFRPDGAGLAGLYDGLPNGKQYGDRLQKLFVATGDDRKVGGGRDAYFIVRKSLSISPGDAALHATKWLEAMHRIAVRVDDDRLIRWLSPLPQIRVLEGTPPKQPKADLAVFGLLRALKVDVPALTDGRGSDCEVVRLLRDAYYYIACDATLRDYLLWPAYADALGEEDAMEGYFELWRHGVKIRVFHDDKIDLYLPRIDAGS